MASSGQGQMAKEDALRATSTLAAETPTQGSQAQVLQEKWDRVKPLYDAGVGAGEELKGGSKDSWQDSTGQAQVAAGETPTEDVPDRPQTVEEQLSRPAVPQAEASFMEKPRGITVVDPEDDGTLKE